MKLHIPIVAVVVLVLLSGCAGTAGEPASTPPVTDPEPSPTATDTPSLSASDLDREFYLTLRNETERHVEQAPEVMVQTSFRGNATEAIEGREETMRIERSRTVKLDREERRYFHRQAILRQSANRTMSSTNAEYVTANRTYVRQNSHGDGETRVYQHRTENFTDAVGGTLFTSQVTTNCLRLPNAASNDVGLLEESVQSIERTGDGTTITYHNTSTEGEETTETTYELRIDEGGWIRSCRSTLTSSGDSGEGTLELVGRIDTSPLDIDAPSWTENATDVSRSASPDA
jgi:hypothetical protein